MSRHVIVLQEPPGHTLVVGWDPPLETYYAQVLDAIERVVERPVSGELRECYELEAFERALAPEYRMHVMRRRLVLYADRDEGR